MPQLFPSGVCIVVDYVIFIICVGECTGYCRDSRVICESLKTTLENTCIYHLVVSMHCCTTYDVRLIFNNSFVIGIIYIYICTYVLCICMYVCMNASF